MGVKTLKFVIFAVSVITCFTQTELMRLPEEQNVNNRGAPKTDARDPKVAIPCEPGDHGPNCDATALQRNYIQAQVKPYDLTDLDSYNCNSVIEVGTCAAGCSLTECFSTTSVTGSTFPADGFCAVFNVSQPVYTNIDWYSASSRICLSSSSHPQGTGLMFNVRNNMNYEVVYKTSQTSSFCYVGYVENDVVVQKDVFNCGTTAADQWHLYNVTVYRDNTFQVSLTTQAGNIGTSGRFNTSYGMSSRGGTLMVNNGSPGKNLQFDEIIVQITEIDECASSPCGSGGTCVDGLGSYTCNCYVGYTGVLCEIAIDECASSPCGSGGTCVDVSGSYICNCFSGYTGVHCETALPPVIYFLEDSAAAGGYITTLTSDGVQTRVAQSGGTYERALAIDIRANLLFYSTLGPPNAVWRADLNGIAGTQTLLWNPTNDAYGLDVSSSDRVLFADDYTSVVMLAYNGTLLNRLNVAKSSYSYGLAVDEIQRILYFTESNTNDRIWKVSFSPTSFVGAPSIILQGIAVGQVGNDAVGLIFEGGTLYWILYLTGEIRSMPVTGSTSSTVVAAAAASGYNSYYLAKKGGYFYYTIALSNGGVYSVIAGGTRTKISPITTLNTFGIDVY